MINHAAQLLYIYPLVYYITNVYNACSLKNHFFFFFFGYYFRPDDRRSEQPCGSVPAAAHQHRPTERFAGCARENPPAAAPVRRVLQAHQPAPPTADSQV